MGRSGEALIRPRAHQILISIFHTTKLDPIKGDLVAKLNFSMQIDANDTNDGR